MMMPPIIVDLYLLTHPQPIIMISTKQLAEGIKDSIDLAGSSIGVIEDSIRHQIGARCSHVCGVYKGEDGKSKTPLGPGIPSCFGTINQISAASRAENDCESCGFHRDCVVRSSTVTAHDPAPKPASNGALTEQVGGSHYKGMKIQHAEFCQVNNLPWCESAAIKYLCRHKQKNGLQDLEKAMHYIRICAKLEYNADI